MAPSTMKAWVFRTSGLPQDVLRLENDRAVPIPGPGEVLVKVQAVGMNPVGSAPMYLAPIKWIQKKPAVPECDVAGMVVGGNLQGTGVAIGDEVFGLVPGEDVWKTSQGTLAEYTAVKSLLLAKTPSNISPVEAASFPLAGLTSLGALLAAGLKKDAGQRVFIYGGSTCTRMWGIQIAQHYGAKVVTTCSPSSNELVSSFSAEATIDNTKGSIAHHLADNYSHQPFDLIFDTIGVSSELFPASPAFLRAGGIYVDIAGSSAQQKGICELVKMGFSVLGKKFRPEWLGGTPRGYILHFLKPFEVLDGLEMAAKLLGSGEWKAAIDLEWSFKDGVLDAYKRQMSKRAKGKVVNRVS